MLKNEVNSNLLHFRGINRRKVNVLKKVNSNLLRLRGDLTQKIYVSSSLKIRDILKFLFYFSMFAFFLNIEHQY